ncbi:hypothetical protein B0J18DRAFT_364326 [Chaetomium sp. MPI-SDFR-AT-0129]|nr:hypothetical protein B0J18DRAFT_364326 [Chaetomium sp. MPI-SDFR-AT-0129]
MRGVFHYFLHLPWELREYIWKLAVRPFLPGAHVFRLYRVHDRDHTYLEYEVVSKNAPWRLSPSRLAAPRCLPRSAEYSPALQATTPVSWKQNNPSTYLIDSGLWTACKESLLVIEAEFQNPVRRRGTWTPSEVEALRKRRGRFNLPETVTFSAYEPRYLTVFPAHDLFIIQVHDVLKVRWDFIWEFFMHCFRKAEAANHSQRHMALEYDPAWDEVAHDSHHREGPAAEFIDDFAMSNGIEDHFTLWLIDYRIKRNPRYREFTTGKIKRPAVKPPAVFYASDRRYVEVNRWDVERWAGHNSKWNAGSEAPREHFCHYCGPHGIIERIEDRYGDWSGPLGNVVYGGVLACEYL